MDLIKKFMKIGGFKTREELEAYGEDRFFNDFPQAKQYAKGGAIEAYPQIATFKNAFSYGVPPGPQYLAHGGSAFPQAQTEAQFFIPIYTDVYNPYNKAYGGSNVEMYPNAKTTPHWGPTNTWFQDGGQQQQQDPQALVQQIAQALQKGMKPQQIAAELAKTGMPQEKAMQAVQMVMQEMQQMAMQQQAPQQEPMPEQMPEQPMMEKGGNTDGKISTTGEKRLKYLTNTVKNVAEIAVQDKITKNATQQFKAGGLVKYQGSDPNQGSQTSNSLTPEELALAKKFNINDPGFSPEGTRLKIKQLQRESWIDDQMQGSNVKIGSQSPFAGLTSEQMTDVLNNWWKETNTKNQQLYGPGPQGPPAYYPAYGPGYRPGQPLYRHPEMIAEYPLGPSGYPYYPQPQYDMRGLMPDLYAYNMSNSFPGASRKTKFSIDGKRAGKFYSNMDLIEAMYPEAYGRGNFEDLMKNNPNYKNRADAFGLSYFQEPSSRIGKIFGKNKYVFNASIPMSINDIPSVKDPGPNPAAAPAAPGATPPAQSKQGVPPMLQDNPAYRAQPQAPGYTNPTNKFMPQAPAASVPGTPSAPAPGSPASSAGVPGQPAPSSTSPGATPAQSSAQPIPAPLEGVGPMRGGFVYPEDVQSEPQLGPYTPGYTPGQPAAPSTAAKSSVGPGMLAKELATPDYSTTPQEFYPTWTNPINKFVPQTPGSVSPDSYMNSYSGNTTGDLPGNTVPAPSPAAPSRPSLMPPPPAAQPAAPAPSGASTVTGQFSSEDTINNVINNESKYFRTRLPNPKDPQFNNGAFDPTDWRSQVPYGQKFTPEQVDNEFLKPDKKKIERSYSGVPDPLKDIAIDQAFNSSRDPRVTALAAAGAIDWNNRFTYYNDPSLLDKTWEESKDLINQQYNDDPQAFTESVSAYRDVAYQRMRTPDQYGKPTDIPAWMDTKRPGLQYPAWHGRTQGTQNFIDQKYFDPNRGYVAPQFFQKYGGLPKAQFGPQEFSNSPLLSPDVNSNQLVEVQGTSSFPNYDWNTGSVAADTPSFQDMVDIGKYEKPIEMGLESEPLSKKLRFDFLEGKNWGANYAFMPVQGVKTGVTAAGSGDGFQTRWMDMTDPALLAERRKEAMNPSQTLSKGLQAPNSNEMYGPFGQRSIILQDFYTPKGVRMASGGNVKQNDVVYWDEDTIREFIANGGQVEYLD